jgi:hypothetical protein
MTNQEIVNKVAKHLRIQGVRSANTTGACKYRGDNGLSCAVGCLIPDSAYHPEWDLNNGMPLIHIWKQIDHLFDIGSRTLLIELQFVHDTVEHWDDDGFSNEGEVALKCICEEQGLEYPQLKE